MMEAWCAATSPRAGPCQPSRTGAGDKKEVLRMFGFRRRHAAIPAPAPAPALDDAVLRSAVRRALSGLIGAAGDWNLVRRRPEDTDDVFRELMTTTIVSRIVASVREAQTRSGSTRFIADTGDAGEGELEVWPQVSGRVPLLQGNGFQEDGPAEPAA
jgi:hypothetical protein